ncbi:MAG: hypothetical protein GY756_25540 [bacterium]|nr:hypothetical protein [bacterium]
MEQDIFYSLRFNLNESAECRGSLFSSIDFFAELYCRLDKLLISTLPLKIEFTRHLKDFGEDSFLFVFKDHILYPDQFPLDHQPEKKNVEIWMNSSRNFFSNYFLHESNNSVINLEHQLRRLGEQLEFNKLLSYRAITCDELENIIIDFQNAKKILDSEKGVIIFE